MSEQLTLISYSGYKCHLGNTPEDAFRMPDGFTKGACFSTCEQYRYSLWRRFDETAQMQDMIAFIGLNPSTADENEPDNTVTRCINYAKAWGYRGMYMLNVFAYRKTDRHLMMKHDKPEAHDYVPLQTDTNLEVLRHAVEHMQTVLACGTDSNHRMRLHDVMKVYERRMSQPICLEVTKHGFPKHPLYCRADLTPQLYTFTPRKKVAK